MFYSVPSENNPLESIDHITRKVHRATIDSEYNALTKNRLLRQNRQQMSLETYVQHLEEANQKLHLQLDQ